MSHRLGRSASASAQERAGLVLRAGEAARRVKGRCRSWWTHEIRSPSGIRLRLKFSTVSSGLSGPGSLGSDLQSVFADFGADLIHSLLCSRCVRGIRLLLENLIVVNVGGFVVLLLVVKFRDFVRILRFPSLQRFQVILSLGYFFALWVPEQKIVK